MFGRSRQQAEIESLQAKVHELEGLVQLLADRAGMGPAELHGLRGQVGPHSGLSERVRSLADQGKAIQAIKEHRRETGLGLKEAKDVVERYLANRR